MFWTSRREAKLEERISDKFYSAFKTMLDKLVKDIADVSARASGCSKKLDAISMSTNERISKLEYLFREEIEAKEKLRAEAIKIAQAKERGNHG